MRFSNILLIFFLLLQIVQIQNISFPSPFKIYKEGTRIDVYANELDSEVTLLPFEYYFAKWCQPQHKKLKKHDQDNIGSLIMGDTVSNTAYDIFMLSDNMCKNQCQISMNQQDVNNFKWLIERNYKQTLVVDGLPNLYQNIYNKDKIEIGIPIGIFDEKKNTYILYNHLDFTIRYHTVKNNSGQNEEQTYNIVEFEVEPFSQAPIQEQATDNSIVYIADCNTDQQEDQVPKLPMYLDGPTEVIFTYSVYFEESDKDLAFRWDIYRQGLGDDDIHWVPLFNSSIINVLLASVIAHILKRTLNKDIEKYQEVNQSDELESDQGWKQLQMDVFRSPKNAILISVFSGIGIQTILMITISLLFTVLGIEQETVRGQFLNSLIVCYIFMGFIAGYFTARIYKMQGGVYWIRATALVSLLYPGIIFLIFIGINLLLRMEQSSMAVGFTTILEITVLWLGISTPLVFLGSFVGFKRQKIEYPCRINPVPSYIPPQPWYLKSKFSFIVGGLLPFGSMLIEFSYIIQSIWHHNYYYLFMFLFLGILILIVTCAEISILMTYLQLNHGNHKWQWRAFLTPAMCGLYIMAFSVYHWITQTQIVRFSSLALYFGFMFIISLTFFVFCGAIGFIASSIFVRKIYGAIKAD